MFDRLFGNNNKKSNHGEITTTNTMTSTTTDSSIPLSPLIHHRTTNATTTTGSNKMKDHNTSTATTTMDTTTATINQETSTTYGSVGGAVKTVDDDNDNNDTSKIVTTTTLSCYENILSSYIGARVVLVCAAAIYATNFPLGALMDEKLPSSAVTMGRMIIASIALSPFISRLLPQYRMYAIYSGIFSAIAYITQSIALEKTNPARVSFLGSATVLWVPVLEAYIDKKPMSIITAPQTWLAALLCFTGVGILELHHSDDDYDTSNTTTHTTTFSISFGDILALIQAIGFGTSCWINNHILQQEPTQFFSVTATLIATTAVISIMWSIVDGWMFQPNWLNYTLPGMLLNPSMHIVALAMIWTGLISTSLNYSIELSALGRMPPSEASVILASEPLWAALFASLLYGTTLSISDTIGGLFIVSACIVNAVLQPHHFHYFFQYCCRNNSQQQQSSTLPHNNNNQQQYQYTPIEQQQQRKDLVV